MKNSVCRHNRLWWKFTYPGLSAVQQQLWTSRLCVWQSRWTLMWNTQAVLTSSWIFLRRKWQGQQGLWRSHLPKPFLGMSASLDNQQVTFKASLEKLIQGAEHIASNISRLTLPKEHKSPLTVCFKCLFTTLLVPRGGPSALADGTSGKSLWNPRRTRHHPWLESLISILFHFTSLCSFSWLRLFLSRWDAGHAVWGWFQSSTEYMGQHSREQWTLPEAPCSDPLNPRGIKGPHSGPRGLCPTLAGPHISSHSHQSRWHKRGPHSTQT